MMTNNKINEFARIFVLLQSTRYHLLFYWVYRQQCERSHRAREVSLSPRVK